MPTKIKLYYFVIILNIVLVIILFNTNKKILAKNNADPTNNINYNTEEKPVKKFNINIVNWGYEPSEINVKKGDHVILNIKNISENDHTFTLDKFGFSTVLLQPSENKTIDFYPDQTGSFMFYCAVYCGDGHNSMNGEIIVTN